MPEHLQQGLLFNQNLFAKKTTDAFVCNLDCSFNLNNNYPGIGDDIQILDGANAIYCGKSGTNYNDASYKAEEDGCNNSQSQPVSCDPNSYSSVLKYYVYYPNLSAATYASCPLPAFIITHPGGFSDCSDIDGAVEVRNVCIEMAKRGYVCFSVEYRRGRVKTPAPYVGASQLLSYYRACQDFRGAIRSIIKRQIQ